MIDAGKNNEFEDWLSPNFKKVHKRRRVFRQIMRYLSTTLKVVVGLFILLFIIVQIPYVQTFIAQKLTPVISKKLNFDITIRAVDIRWFDETKLYNVHIKDRAGEEMLGADVIKLDFSVFSLIKGNDIFMDQVVLSNADINLIKRDSLNMSQFVKAITSLRKKPADSTRKVIHFNIASGILDNVRFGYRNANADSIVAGKFNPNNFHFNYISANLNHFQVAKDTIKMTVKSMSGTEGISKLRIKKLKTEFQYCNTGMVMDDLHVEMNTSVLRDSLALRYKSPEDFQHFTNKVRIYANLKNSILHTEDLALFAPSLKAYDDTYIISGEVKGTVNNLLIKNLDTQFGKNSHIRGKATFFGLPNINSTLLDLKFKKSTMAGTDLTQYVPNNAAALRSLGTIKLNAKFYGLISDFVSEGKFNTDLGYIETDINLKTKDESYKGKIATKHFNLGKFLGQEKYIQTLDMSGNIQGKGLRIDNADFNLDATIKQITVMDYSYSNIVTDGHFKQKLFEGELSVDDPNLKIAIDGSINFIDSTFNFIAKLDTISFDGTKLMDKSGHLKTLVEANFTGLEPSKISGKIGLFATELMYEGTELDLDFLSVISNKDINTNKRKLIVNSELFNFNAEGNFEYKQLISDSKRFLKEVQLGFSGNDSLQNAYYKAAEYKQLIAGLSPYSLKFDLKTKKVNKLLRLFDKKVYVGPGSSIKGSVGVGQFNNLKLQISSDTLLYGEYETFSDSASLTIFKHVDSVFFESELLISSAYQEWDELETKDLRLFSLSNNETLLFNNGISHRSSGDEVNVQGTIRFLKDNLAIDLTQTSFRFLNGDWKSTGQSKVLYQRDGQQIQFDNLEFSYDQQYVKIDGTASKENDSLRIDIQNLNLDIFSTYIKKELEGQASITASISQVLGDLTLNGDINIDSIVLAGYEVGSIVGKSEWDNQTKKIELNARLLRKDHEVVKIDGYYSPKAAADKKLNIRTVLDGASLQIIQPFAGDFVSDIDGTAIGILKIKGSPSSPIVKGDVFVYRGKFKVNYLNTTYYFSDRIRFRDGFIGTKNLLLNDSNGQKAYINGGVYHHEFGDFIFQIDGKLKNFMALNTSATDESLYYGTAIATGSFGVFGPLDNIELSVTAKSERGTKLYIPLDGYASVSDASFIRFLSDDSVKTEVEEELDLKGLKLDFNIEVTPDAYFEIIFDKKSGDIIRGNAQGKINMLIDLLGEFSMFGDVEILRGGYNFTLLNIVNKEFGVQPNSHISWSGDPYGANLDIIATYTQKASLAPILQNLSDSSLINSPEVRRAYPVQVLLNLKGKLLNPDITFGIDIQNYPNTVLTSNGPISLESYVSAFEQRTKRDEQELNRQVFSLIILKRLSAENTFSGISQSAGSSVSELLTNQLSYWISQVDENLEIDLDLNSLGPDALNTFQLRLSYTFLDGRLRISREGGFTNTQNEADPSSLIGDWTVEYLLTPDGKLRLKMYRKQNVNSFNTGLENNSTAGLSVIRTKSFNSFKELFSKKKKKKKQKKKEEKANKEEEEKNSLETDKTKDE